MRHFGHIAPEVRERLFHQEPCVFTADSPARMLAVALGATLYSPATRPKLADDIVKQTGRGVVSMVLCLEDSIDDARGPGGRGEPGPAVRRPGRARPRTPSCRCCSSGSAAPEQIPDLVRPARRGRPAVVRIRTAEVHRGARDPVPGGAHRRPRPRAGGGCSRCRSWNRPTCCTARPGRETLRGHRPDRRQVPRPGARAAPRRHRLLLRVRAAQGARHDRLRRADRRVRDRRRGERARPGRRHRLHGHRARVGVLPAPGAHVQAAAAAQPLQLGRPRTCAPR